MTGTDAVAMARRIDAAVLKAEATEEEVAELCAQAVRYRFYGVCVNPVHVSSAVRRLERLAPSGDTTDRPVVVSVAGFPLGASRTEVTVAEARRVLDDGALEVDMVARIDALVAGDVATAGRDIEAVAAAVHGTSVRCVLKVILETSVQPVDRIIAACRCCREAGADFVKTSTGFHPSGGATVEHVRLLRGHAAPLRVKASGGIRDATTALAMVEAGADRIGTSSGVDIVRALGAG